MLNSYYIGGNTTNNKCEVRLNTPSTGFIQKSNPVSRFIRFQRGSEIEKLLFPTDPRDVPMLTYKHTVCKHDYNFDPTGYKISYEQEEVKEEVTVLQVCIFGSDYMLAEYVFNKDMADKQESENNKE
jgi:hypothetical protein